MIIEKLASAIRNDVVSGLRGYHTGQSLSMDQLEDDIIDTRLQIINEYKQKGILPIQDLALSINCITTDCKNLESCKCSTPIVGTPTIHFEIPQFIELTYVGSVDKQTQFVFYTNPMYLNYHKYRKRGKDKPYIFIDTTPNENGMCDGFVFNAPLLKQLSITGVFKDPRQLEIYGCCSDDDNMNFINQEIKNRLVQQKIAYYRQNAAPIKPNTQSYE